MTEATTKAADEGSASPDDKADATAQAATDATGKAREIGGRKGPDPVRYGDWEKNGRCIDF